MFYVLLVFLFSISTGLYKEKFYLINYEKNKRFKLNRIKILVENEILRKD